MDSLALGENESTFILETELAQAATITHIDIDLQKTFNIPSGTT